MSWLPTLPKLAVPSLSMKVSLLFTQPILRRSHQVSAFAFSVVVGLVWGSYLLLSRSKTTVDLAVLAKQPATTAHQLALASSPEPKPISQPFQNELADEDEPKEETSQTQLAEELHTPAASKRIVSRSEQINQPESDAVVRTTFGTSDQHRQTAYPKPASVRLTTVKPTTQDKPGLVAQMKTDRVTQAKSPVVPSETMSDLEKELNSPVYHKNKP